MKEDLLTNFIPLNRKLFEHSLWCEEREYSRFEAWLYLLKEARFENTKVIDKGRFVLINRGQIYASIRFLAEAFGWSTKKVGSYLQMLEMDSMIKRETVKETGQTMITICNYEKYNTTKLDEETPRETQRKQQGNAEETKSNTVNKGNTVDKEILSSESMKKSESLEVRREEQRKKLDAAKAATRKRKDDFYKTLIPYVDRYGKEMTRAFFDYWSEPNRSGSKMKFELQRTWDLALRLGTWANREPIYGKTKETVQAGPTIVD